MSASAAPRRLQGLAMTLRRPGAGRAVARTAGFNVGSTVAAGLGGLLLARTLGPTVRGEYAAITAWFGITLMVGGMGQPAALCFYVARDPLQAREYVATSRAMMLTTGTLALTAGILLAPVLSRGNPEVAVGYRIAFGASIVAFVGASYTFSLQARDLRRWNVVRVSQPVLSLAAVCALWSLRLLTLRTALIVLAVTMALQLVWAYRCCRVTGLAPGRPQARLVRPLTGYGAAQIAALTPAALNSQLDQLVLSQTVPAADLGRYAIAVSLTLLPMPLVSAIGNVAFPRLAAQRVISEAARRLQLLAVLASAGLAAGLLVPLAAAAYWLVPFVFGAGYRGAIPLLWILTPGAVFLACGQVVGDLLRGTNHPGVVAWAQGLAAVFTVVLLIALLPVVGVSGAAIASTVAYGVALAVMLRLLLRRPRHVRGRGRLSDAPEPPRGNVGEPMSTLRHAAAAATDLACRAVGRRHVVRAARFVLHRARLDIPNDLSTNGESSLQRWILELSSAGREIHVFDVGANVGRWSSAMLVAARQGGRLDDLRLRAYEPSSYTFACLSKELDGQPVSLHQVALGERSGSAMLHVMAPGAGINSLYEAASLLPGVTTEEVATTTLDACADQAGLDQITLVKIDTEGHDLAVLCGARRLFAEHRILAAQFEYNHRWIIARSFLRDAFELLVPLGYRLGKLTPRGVEFYPGWDAELETFAEGNYLACVPQVAECLPSVAWWKSAS